MKCLSVKQPFAELIISRRKNIELRNWKTNYRGDLLIHASRVPDGRAMKKFGFEKDDLPLGAVIGKAKLIGCKEYRTKADFAGDRKLHLSVDYTGEHVFGFILESPIRFSRPIPIKGRLGLFELKSKYMADKISKEQRSYNMSRIRSKNTGPELKLKPVMKKLGFAYQPKMHGHPDFASKKLKTVVFVDGCFWHGCPKHYRAPKSNMEYWQNKTHRNVLRDKKTNKFYMEHGWKVVRIWEHDLT